VATRVVAGSILGVALAVTACSSNAPATSDEGGSSSSAEGTVIGCATDPRAQTYSAGMTEKGQAGHFTFVLVSSTPAPPAQYTNSWVIAVEDAQGNKVPGATLTSVTPWMPDHGHGTSTPTITPNPDGTITVSDLYLFMIGLWQTTIVAEAGGENDSAVFSFCVGE
jgi:hypothetical protein